MVTIQSAGHLSGVVRKRGKNLMWKTRYLSLEGGPDGVMNVSYYKNETDPENKIKPKSVFKLVDCRLDFVATSPSSSNEDKEDDAVMFFVLTAPTRELTLCGKDDDETKEWFYTLQSAKDVEKYLMEDSRSRTPGPMPLTPTIQNGGIELNLDHQLITYDCLSVLSETVKNNDSLISVSLQDTGIADALVPPLLSVLLQTHEITAVNLAHNHISDKGILALVEALFMDFSVTHLVLSNNDFGDNGAIQLAEMLKVNPNIQHLNLSYNNIGPAGVAAIFQALEKSSLLTLDISGNKVGDEGCAAIAKQLENGEIEYLGLASAEIGDEGGMALADAVARSKTLCEIDIQSDPLSNDTMAALFNAVAKTQIRCLRASPSAVKAIGPLLKEEFFFSKLIIERPESVESKTK